MKANNLAGFAVSPPQQPLNQRGFGAGMAGQQGHAALRVLAEGIDSRFDLVESVWNIKKKRVWGAIQVAEMFDPAFDKYLLRRLE